MDLSNRPEDTGGNGRFDRAGVAIPAIAFCPALLDFLGSQVLMCVAIDQWWPNGSVTVPKRTP